MWRLTLCLFVSTIVRVAAIELHCGHLQCIKKSTSAGRAKFTVEGLVTKFSYWNLNNNPVWELFTIDCDGWDTLDSPALPHSSSEIRVSSVVLTNCPIPPSNASIVTALAALNITLQSDGEKSSLELAELPTEQLTAQQFLGLENLTQLIIDGNGDPRRRPTPEPGFLVHLQKLKKLHMTGVRLAAGEVYRFPQSLTELWLSGESLNSLPGTLTEILSETTLALPGLHVLILDQYGFTVPEYTDAAINNDIVQSNATSALNTLYMLSWKARQLTPLDLCNKLVKLEIRTPEVEELPDRWLAACPHLENVTLEYAQQLTSLPANLLEGATSLKRLSIRFTGVRTLPEGFLEGAPNLVELDLSNNRLLYTPPTGGVFLSPALQSLTKLNLDHCDRVHVSCNGNGYSTLQNFTHLNELSLRVKSITEICRDWRENFLYLEKLILTGTGIRELKFADFLFTRDASVVDSKVILSTYIDSLNFTNEDYKNALVTPGSGVTMEFQSTSRSPPTTVNCDCDAYWLRRAVMDTKVIKITGLKCKDGRDFPNVTPEEMCPDIEESKAHKKIIRQ